MIEQKPEGSKNAQEKNYETKEINFGGMATAKLIAKKNTLLMAGNGFMNESTNFLILKKYNKYRALFLVKSGLYVNCFGVLENQFDLIFTHFEDPRKRSVDLSEAEFSIKTVTDESKIILSAKNQRIIFGLKINLPRKKIDFIQRKDSLCSRTIKFFDFKIVKTPSLNKISRLILEGCMADWAAIYEARYGMLKKVLDIGVVLKELANRSHSGTLGLNFVSIKHHQTEADRIEQPERGLHRGLCSITFTFSTHIIVIKLNLKFKKVLQSVTINLEDIKAWVESQQRMDLRIESAEFISGDNDTLLITAGDWSRRRDFDSWVIKLQDCFHKKKKNITVIPHKASSILVEFWQNKFVLYQTKRFGTFEPRGILDYQKMKIFDVPYGKVDFMDGLRPHLKCESDVAVDLLLDGSKNLILRTPDQIFLIKPKIRFFVLEEPGSQKIEDTANFIHCFKSSIHQSETILAGYLVYLRYPNNVIDIFRKKELSRELVHFKRIDLAVDLDSGGLN